MTAFYIDEASMELPGGLPYVDRSVNVIEVPGPEGSELGLLIERAPIPPGKSLREVAAAKEEKHARELRGYTVLGQAERLVDGLPALETRLRWRHPEGPIYNMMVHVGLDGVCLTFLTSCRWERAEACDAWLESLLSSVQFRSR